MQRREVVRFLGAALTLPFLPRSAERALELGEELHRRTDVTFRTLDHDAQLLVADLSEMIIPKTDTVGATDVRVPEFIDLILTEWAHDDERAKFLAGLKDIDAKAAGMGAQRFVDLPADKKHDLVAQLDGARGDDTGAGHTFGQLKHLTVYGYFTSKPVQDNILKTRMFFDGYHGNVPFTPAV